MLCGNDNKSDSTFFGIVLLPEAVTTQFLPLCAPWWNQPSEVILVVGRLEAELKLVLIIFRGYKMYLNKDNKIKLRIVSNIFIFKLVAVKFCRVSIDYEQKPVPASQPELIQK